MLVGYVHEFVFSSSYTRFFQVSDLLGKFPDLMEGFKEFLEHCERLGNHRF